MSTLIPSFTRIHAPGWRRLAHWFLILAGTAAYLWGHLHIGFQLADQKNLDPQRSDQANNMKCAREAALRATPSPAKGLSRNISDWLPHYTDGVVNPLWPRVAATFSEGLDDESFFEAGKRWNVIFTGVFLAIVAIALGARWSAPAVLLFLLAAGLGAFLPRSPWFQPEPLYYALFLLSWATGAALLKKNPLWLYALFGLLTGLAYLAKASIQPLLLVFLGVTTLRFLAAVFPKRRPATPREQSARSPWSPSNHFIGLSILACVHLTVITPRLAYSREAYGSPMHAFPSYWMWMDDFEQGYAWMGNYNTKEKLAALPADARPSLKNWLATHDRTIGLNRLADGTWWQVRRLLASDVTPRDKHGKPRKPWQATLERPGWTLATLAGLAALATGFAISERHKEKLPIHRQEPERGMLILYTLGALSLYAMLHGWYTPVGDGDRFMLALYPPLALSLVAAGESIMARLQARNAPAIIPLVFRFAQWLAVGWLGWRLLELCRIPRFA